MKKGFLYESRLDAFTGGSTCPSPTCGLQYYTHEQEDIAHKTQTIGIKRTLSKLVSKKHTFDES